MHPPWTSTEEIAAYFRTRASANETDALRAEIEQQLRDYHPDKSGGDFESENQGIRFYELQDALRFLKKIGSQPTRHIYH